LARVQGAVQRLGAAPPRVRAARPRRTPDRADPLAVARALPLDRDLLERVVAELARIGSSPLGFRVTGTPEDHEAARIVAGHLRDSGLEDVAVAEVRVDGWRFAEAELRVEPGAAIEGAALGGTPATPAGGAEGPVLDGGGGSRRELDRLDVRGALVLVDWRKGPLGPSDVGLELGLRGAAGVLVAPAAGGPYFQADGALGAFDGHWHAGAPPMMTLRRADAQALRAQLAGGPLTGVLHVRAEVVPGARGANAEAFLPGERPGPIVVGAHHDGWFRAAFDNATGVAALVAIARALVEAGHRPRHRICFTSRTGEEYGLLDRTFDWCVGAWRQVSETHPRWGARAPFHLCLEASGHPGLRLALEAPVELVRWARAAGRAGEAQGWLTSGWRTSPPVTGTEQWPLLVAGVPGVAAYTWEPAFATGIYHTPLDTPEVVDFAHLERLTRFYAFLLLSADRDPGGILDHRARARDLARRARALGERGAALAGAAQAHAGARGRGAFTRVGRALHAVDAKGAIAYPHEQAAADLEGLEAALAALEAGDTRGTIRRLAGVGENALAGRLSEPAFARRAERLRREAGGDSWAGASHLTASPGLWAELAALRGEAGARPAGPWIERSLRRHAERTRAELDRRVAAMSRAIAPPHRTDPRRST
jgi:peptidase M28-like protein